MKTIIINHFDISEYTYNMKKYISKLNIKNYDILKLCTEDTFLYLIEANSIDFNWYSKFK